MRTHSGRYFAGTCICSIPTLSGGSAINRRSVLSGLAAAVVAASVPTSLGASSARAQAAASAPPFIDVHHHFVPPVYLAENRDRVSLTQSNGNHSGRSTRWMRRTSQPPFFLSHYQVCGSVTRRRPAGCRGYATNMRRILRAVIAGVSVCSRSRRFQISKVACARSNMRSMCSKQTALVF